MNSEDWKVRCDSYKEIINTLEVKNLILREQKEKLRLQNVLYRDLLQAICDQSESLSLKFKINEVLK